MAVAVIGGAAVGVREHLVGLGGLLEALLGVGVLVDVGVQLPGQAAKRLLDLGVVGAPGDAQDLVVVPWHLRAAHRSSYTSTTKRDSWAAASRTVRMAWP